MAGPTRTSIIDFETEAWAQGMRAAWSRLQGDFHLRLAHVGDKLVASARRYCVEDTGRLKDSIFSTEAKKDEQGRSYIEFGVNLGSLQAAALSAQKKVYSQIRKGGATPSPSSKLARKMGVPSQNYASFIEFGTSKMRARPFLRPALAEVAGYIGPIMAGPRVAGTPSTRELIPG